MSRGRRGISTLEMVISEGFSLPWVHGSGWEEREVHLMPPKKSRSIGPTFSGKLRAGTVGRDVSDTLAGLDGRSVNDTIGS